MPRGAWTKKDERKYEAIFESCRFGSRPRAEKTCKRIAAATVNRDRALRGLTTELDVRSGVLVETSAAPLKKGIPRVIKARDPETGTLVGELKLRSTSNGVTTEWVEVDYTRRGTKVAQALYRRAAELACAQGLTVRSDETRSEAADAFWQKQVRAGHAVAVAGRGTRYDPDTGRAKGRLDVKHYELRCPPRELAGPKRRKR